MQKTARNDGTIAGTGYRERLSPSLWVLASAAVVAPMAGLVFVPIDHTLSLAIGITVGVLTVALLVGLSPVIAVANGTLRAGRARIPVELLGEPTALEGEDARQGRGVGLDPRSWHVIRGGIDGLVTIPVTDPDDPTPAWTLSTRTPDRLAAAVRRAQSVATPRTPRR